MRRIEKQFTYPIWDEWRTNSFTQGRTGTHTYKGPEFITVEVNKDPNHEESQRRYGVQGIPDYDDSDGNGIRCATDDYWTPWKWRKT